MYILFFFSVTKISYWSSVICQFLLKSKLYVGVEICRIWTDSQSDAPVTGWRSFGRFSLSIAGLLKKITKKLIKKD